MPERISLLGAAASAVLLAAGAASMACETCPFQLASRDFAQGTLQPGAFAVHDMTVAAEDSLEIDLSNAAPAAGERRVDAWLVPPDCAQLFDEPYPGPSGALPAPRCTVILGPVAPGTVSGRVKASPGVHRVILQAWVTNTSSAPYDAEIGTWGRTCRQILLNRRR